MPQKSFRTSPTPPTMEQPHEQDVPGLDFLRDPDRSRRQRRRSRSGRSLGRPVDYRRGQHPDRQAPYPHPRHRCARTTAAVPVRPRERTGAAGRPPRMRLQRLSAAGRCGASNAMSTATAVWSPSVSPAAPISARSRCDRAGPSPTADIRGPMWPKKTRHAEPVAVSGPARSRCPGTGAGKTGDSYRPITADPTTSGRNGPRRAATLHPDAGVGHRLRIATATLRTHPPHRQASPPKPRRPPSLRQSADPHREPEAGFVRSKRVVRASPSRGRPTARPPNGGPP